MLDLLVHGLLDQAKAHLCQAVQGLGDLITLGFELSLSNTPWLLPLKLRNHYTLPQGEGWVGWGGKRE